MFYLLTKPQSQSQVSWTRSVSVSLKIAGRFLKKFDVFENFALQFP